MTDVRAAIAAEIRAWWKDDSESMDCCGCSTYDMIVEACLRAVEGKPLPRVAAEAPWEREGYWKYNDWDKACEALDNAK